MCTTLIIDVYYTSRTECDLLCVFFDDISACVQCCVVKKMKNVSN